MENLKLRGWMLLMLLLFFGMASAQDLWDGTVATSFSGGTGTETDPYQIRTGAELMYFVNLVNAGDDFNGKTVKMMNDIDLNQNNFNVRQFAGTFDGGGHFLTIQFGATTSNPLFGSVSGRIHHLGVYSTIKAHYKGVSYCVITLVNSLQETGILEDCYYIVNGGAELFYYQETYARNNYGMIRNCYAGGSFRIYGETTGTLACQLVYTNYTTGVIENCYAFVNNGKTSSYYGARNIPIAYVDNGITIHNFTNTDSLNTWVDEHPNHSRWTNEGEYKLVDFNPQNESTISFVDELFGIKIPSYKVTTGNAIGTLPIPTADCTFIGWTRFGNIVTPTDIVSGDWTLFSKWEQRILKQPTQSDMSLSVDDIDHASFQWYAIYGEAQHFGNWQSVWPGHGNSYSDTILVSAKSGQLFKFSYDVSSEPGCDMFYFICNGTTLLRTSGEEKNDYCYEIPADGVYQCVFRYSKDDDTSEGRDNVLVKDITLTDPNTPLDCTSSQLPDYLITQNGLYYCDVTYSNTGVVLTSDTVKIDERYLDNILEIVGTTGFRGMLLTVPINLVNHESITSFEFLLTLPEGVTLVDKSLGERSENHKRTSEQFNSETWHFIVQSPNSLVFDGNEGNVLYLILGIDDNLQYGDYSITLSDVALTTVDGTILRPKDAIARLSLNPAGDVDGNGEISIADVTELIDYLLSK